MALPFKKKTVQPGITMGGAEAPTGQPQASQTVSGTGQGNTSPSQGGGIFSNLRKYVDANKDTNLGQKIVDNTQKKADILTPQITTARDEVVRKLGEEQTRLNSATQTPPQQQQPATPQPTAPTIPTTQYGGLFGQVEQDPTKLDNSQIEQFKQIYGGNYAAPTTDLSGINPQVAALNDIAKNAGTEQGRYGLLQSNFGRPTYSTGQQRLDQLLLQNAPGQGKLLQSGTQNIANTQADALKGLNTQQTNAQDAIRTLAGTRQTEAQGLLGTEAIGEGKGTGLLGGMVDSLEQRSADAQSQEGQVRDVLSKALSGKGFSSPEESAKVMEMLQGAGVNLDQKTYGIGSGDFTPEQFFNKLNTTPEALATKQEQDKLKSLYGLAGKDQNFLTGQVSDKPFNIGNVLNQGEFDRAMGAKKSEFEGAASPYNQTINKLTPAVTLQKDIQSGMDPVKAMGKAVNAGLDPQIMSDLVSSSSEFRGRQNNAGDLLLPATLLNAMAGLNSGGMHGRSDKLSDILSWQNNVPTYQNQIAEAQKQYGNIQQQYGAGNTLRDLLQKYQSIPTQGTAGTLPTATGPGGKIGLF